VKTYYQDEAGTVLSSNLKEGCQECYGSCGSISEITLCKLTNKKRRRGRIVSERGLLYACSDQADMMASSRLFKESLEVRSEFIAELKALRNSLESEARKQIKRLIHNLTTLNAHCIQEIYSFIPQEQLSNSKQDEQTRIIAKFVTDDTKAAAQLFTRILKNNTLMKVEFSVFNKLYEASPRIDKRSHPIRKVILNVFHIFFPDFTDKDVLVKVQEFNEKVDFDYESITVALMHLIENSSKYILPNTVLNVTFESLDRELKVIFDMISIKIEDSEKEKIFTEGYSGTQVKGLGLAGKGIGLFVAKEILRINKGHLSVKSNVDPIKAKKQMGLDYENNQFILSLPK